MSVFEKGVFTPNDAFYVRWHLGSIPDEIDVTSFRLKIHGEVISPLELSLEQLQHDFEPVQLAAVNQCSGTAVASLIRACPVANGEMARWETRCGPASD